MPEESGRRATRALAIPRLVLWPRRRKFFDSAEGQRLLPPRGCRRLDLRTLDLLAPAMPMTPIPLETSLVIIVITSPITIIITIAITITTTIAIITIITITIITIIIHHISSLGSRFSPRP